MGADGPGLFADDTACDVREAYRDAIADGASDEAARQLVLTEFADDLDDSHEGAVVWLALAHTQSMLGRLDDETRRRAIAILDSGADIDRWRETGEKAVRLRTTALKRVRRRLEGPQPARKSVRHRRPPRPVSGLNAEQVLGHRGKSGRFLLVRVTRIVETKEFSAPIIRILDHAESVLPSDDQLAQLVDIPDGGIPSVIIGTVRDREAYFFEVGVLPERVEDVVQHCATGLCEGAAYGGWGGLATWFSRVESEINRLGFAEAYQSTVDSWSPYAPSTEDS